MVPAVWLLGTFCLGGTQVKEVEWDSTKYKPKGVDKKKKKAQAKTSPETGMHPSYAEGYVYPVCLYVSLRACRTGSSFV